MDASSIIVLDSSDEESGGEPKRRKLAPTTTLPGSNGNPNMLYKTPDQSKIKRIKPITVATNLSKEAENNNRPPVNENFALINFSDDWEKDHQKYQQIVREHERQQKLQQQQGIKLKSPLSAVTEDNDRKTATPGSSSTGDSHSTNRSEKKEKKSSVEKNPIGKEFADLLDACRKADPSKEMELLIQKKLIRYYECVHPDYINSKSFKKTLAAVTQDVSSHPELVYLKLSSIVEELNIRRKSRQSVMTNENITSTGSEKKDNQIRRLNRALYILKKRIEKLEEMEVDFEEDINSAFMMEERYKKRAFEIYEKICDITGESKHAHRIVRKPIKFDGTVYSEFNRTVQTFVNRTGTFPDFFDVLKCLQHCNTQYGYRLRRDEMTKIAQDAFIRIGKLLQKRRKTDLYETVSYYSGLDKDPALADKRLNEKLEDNKKHYGKIGDIIDKFARVQDNDTDDEAEPSHSSKPSSSSKPATVVSDTPKTSNASKEDAGEQSVAPSTSKDPTTSVETKTTIDEALTSDKEADASSSSVNNEENKPKSEGKSPVVESAPTEELEEDGDDDEEDDEDEDEMVIKENVKPDTFDDIDISDDEELIVPTS